MKIVIEVAIPRRVRPNQKILKESSKKLEVLQTVPGSMRLLNQKEHNLLKIVLNEGVIVKLAQTPEGKAYKFLQQAKVVLPVLVERVKRV